jgi:hypothetical protein
MVAGLLPGPSAIINIKSREDVQRVQNGVNRVSIILDGVATTCAQLDAATFQSWRLTGYVPAQQYAQEEVPSAINIGGLHDMWERGILIRQQLDAWAAKFRAAGCNVPLVEPGGAWDGVITGIKWVGTTLVVLAALGLAIKVAEIAEDVTR